MIITTKKLRIKMHHVELEEYITMSDTTLTKARCVCGWRSYKYDKHSDVLEAINNHVQYGWTRR